MNGINKVTLESISIKDPQDGQWGQWWSYGIKVNGEWWNGSLKSQEQVDGMLARKGQEVELFFWVDSTKDPKYANKVRFVTDKDRKEAPKESQKESHSYQSPEVALSEAFKRIEALEYKINSLLPKETEPTDLEKAESDPQAASEEEPLTDLPF